MATIRKPATLLLMALGLGEYVIAMRWKFLYPNNTGLPEGRLDNRRELQEADLARLRDRLLLAGIDDAAN